MAMKHTSALELVFTHHQARDVIIMHPNAGFEIDMMTKSHPVNWSTGLDARDFLVGKEGSVQPLRVDLLNEWVYHLDVDGFQVVPNRPVPTYADSGSTLDYVIVSGDVLLRSWEVEENFICQHYPLTVEILVPEPLAPLEMPLRSRNLLFYEEEVAKTRELLKISVSGWAGPATVENLYATVESCFLSGGTSSSARDHDRAPVASWWRYVPTESRDLVKQLELEAKYIFDNWCGQTGSVSLSEVVAARRHLNSVSMRIRREADKEIQREMGKDFPNQALCWKILRKIRNPVESVKIDIGTLTNHFTNVFHRRDRPVLIRTAGGVETSANEVHFDLPFTDDELVAALKSLNGAAATGPELVPSSAIKEVFKDSDSRVLLLSLVNACWDEGRLPAPWGEAELFILYKGKGSRSLADNYRAIALSNDFRRIYERLVGARLSAWIRCHDATGPMQFGFKPGSSTLEAIFVLRTAMLHGTHVLSRPMYAVFVDIKKVFPSTSRAKVVEVFERNRVPKKITESMAALLSGSSSRLRVNNRLTDPITVTSGTPEGSINSPDIFSVVYTEILKKVGGRELPEDLSQLEPDVVYYIVFADDITFFGMNVRNICGVVSQFKKECAPCDLQVNSGKTKWMSFIPPGVSSVHVSAQDWEFRVDDEVIEQVDEFPYLGFRLDTRLSDSGHVKTIVTRMMKAARATGQIMRDMKCSNLISLQYELAVGVFFKTALGLADSFPSAAAMSILGITPIQVFQQEQRIKFLMKSEAKLPSPVFTCLLHDRCVLFPMHVGVNALLGDVLVSLDAPRTLDFKWHFSAIVRAVETRAVESLRSSLLVASGRAFWTELAPSGFFEQDLRSVLSSLPFEQLKICILFLTDTLRWSTRLTSRFCHTCKSAFTVEHFFTCPQDFLSGRGWQIFVSLCANHAWLDLIEFIFDLLQKWALETELFSPEMRVTVLEFEPFHQDEAMFNPFRFNV